MIRKRKSSSEQSTSFRMLPEDVLVQASQGQTLLDAILIAKIDIDHTCGGMGTCGTCRVFVEQGLELFEEPGPVEEEIRTDREFKANERLCCQNLAKTGLVLRRP